MSAKSKVVKYDAKHIESGALEQEGKEIVAQIKIMDGYQAEVQKLAGVNWEKFQNNKATVEKRLVAVAAKCKAEGFKAFKAKYAPTFGRTKLYHILQIAAGKTTREEIRAETAERVRKHRSLHGNVTDTLQARAADGSPLNTAELTPAAKERLAKALVGSAATQISDDEAKARMAVLAGETPPTPEPTPEPAAEPTAEQPPARTLTPEEISDEALVAYKKAAAEIWPKMLKPELEHVRKWTTEQTVKLETKLLKLAAVQAKAA